MIDIFDNRFKELKYGGRGFVEVLKREGKEKQISHAIKQLSGRMKELKYLRGLVNNTITTYFNKFEEITKK